jgi:hypothetical protein
MDLDHQRTEKIRLATRTMEDTEAFISRNPGIFEAPLDTERLRRTNQESAVFVVARQFRDRLNAIGNELNVIGGEIPPIMHDLGELIRHLDIIVKANSFYSQNQVFAQYVVRADEQPQESPIHLQTIQATSTQSGLAYLSDPDDSNLLINNSIPAKKNGINDIYHALHVIFSANSEFALRFKNSKHLGWVLLNMTLRKLQEDVTKGRALGKVWDGNEIHASARRIAKESGIHAEHSIFHSCTLISNVVGDPKFDRDPLKLRSLNPAETQARIRSMLNQICEWIVESVEVDPQAQTSKVMGGRDGFVPLNGILVPRDVRDLATRTSRSR